MLSYNVPRTHRITAAPIPTSSLRLVSDRAGNIEVVVEEEWGPPNPMIGTDINSKWNVNTDSAVGRKQSLIRTKARELSKLFLETCPLDKSSERT